MNLSRDLLPQIGAHPNGADIAFVSTDVNGTRGELNSWVLKLLGYSDYDLPSEEELQEGYYLLKGLPSQKPIIFIVTVGLGDTRFALEENLANSIKEHSKDLDGKIVWVPLMGTGDGGLSFNESYWLTEATIRKYYALQGIQGEIVLSVPDSEEGRSLIQELSKDQNVLKEEKIKNEPLIKKENLEHDIDDEDLFEDALKIEIEKIVEQKKHFYAVGHIWYNQGDQMPRFLNYGIWENGHDEKAANIVNRVQKGDVLLVKASFTGDLRIKAIGSVTENIENGHELRVNWIEIKHIDIPGRGGYRSTIAKIGDVKLVQILTEMYRQLPEVFEIIERLEQLPVGTQKVINPSTIAGMHADVITGPDYLGIDADVQAFAKIMASKALKPPLAIALFGKWGSGKSFFMEQLRGKVNSYSTIGQDVFNSKPNKLYCEGIAQVHFNAWSYLDANLWASIVSRIFEEIHSYLNGSNVSDDYKKMVKKELGNRLNLTKEERDFLEQERKHVESKLEDLNKEKAIAEDDLKSSVEKVKENSLYAALEKVDTNFKVRHRIGESIKNNSGAIKTIDEIEKIIPQSYLNDPIKSYHEIRSVSVFLKEFFRPSKVISNLIWIAVIIGLIIFLPFLLFSFEIVSSIIEYRLPQVVLSGIALVAPLFLRIRKVTSDLQPIVSSFWSIKVEYEAERKKAQMEHELLEKVIEQEISLKKEELHLIDSRILIVSEDISSLKLRLENALSTESLHSFIQKRVEGNDYSKHLGLVSMIRADFATLTSLLQGHIGEWSDDLKADYGTPLERIILYIDDLDRCPGKRVVEVLEAVNLLMAFPLFVVVVGVDPLWVKNALKSQYPIQFGTKLEKESRTDPSEYLEKIFQVPFHLKNADNKSVKHMITKLASKYAKESDSKANVIADKGENLNEKFQSSQMGEFQLGKTQLGEVQKFKAIDFVQLSDDEVGLLPKFSVILGENPRAIKRFVNTYQIVKAHAGLRYIEANEEKVHITIMFLLSLSIGPYSSLLPYILAFIMESENNNPMLMLTSDTSEIFFELETGSTLQSLKDRLVQELSKAQLNTILSDIPPYIYREQCEFIKRFTFSDL